MKDVKMRKSDTSRINVGDIVRYKNSDFPLGVVTAINKVGNTWVLDKCGFSEVYQLKYLAKTGKTVNIRKVLKNLGNPFGDLRREEWSDNRNKNIHKHTLGEIKFINGLVKKIHRNKKDDWNKIEDENIGSYPPAYKNILVKTSDGKVYRGFRNFSNDWAVDIGDGKIIFINNMIAWKELD